MKGARRPGSGTAQALLRKGKSSSVTGASSRRLGGVATVGSTGSGGSGAVGGRAKKLLANSKSKMKMIDVAEVQGLNHGVKKEDTRESKLSAKKRKIMEAAAQRGLVAKKRKLKNVVNQDHPEVSSPSLPSHSIAQQQHYVSEQQHQQHLLQQPHGTQPPSENLSSYDISTAEAEVGIMTAAATDHLMVDAASSMMVEDDTTGYSFLPNDTAAAAGSYSSPPHPEQHEAVPSSSGGGNGMINNDNNSNNHSQDWQMLLQTRSNKLSIQDRFRVQKFFVQRFNPTPDQPVYKMKLHEERTTDPQTGQAMKETYYLELDYTTFTSKQSKKIKRY